MSIYSKEEVVVTAGQTMVKVDGKRTSKSNTEIYSVEDRQWRVGTPFPLALAYPASLQYEDSFLVMGGDYDFCSNKIFKARKVLG